MPTPASRREQLDVIVRDMVRPLSVGFGLFIAWQAIQGWTSLEGTDRLIIAGTDTLVAAYLLGLSAFMWFRPPPLRQMNAWGATLAIALAGTDMTTMATRGAIPELPATLFVLAGYGAVVLSWRWFLAVEAGLLATWYLIAAVFTSNPEEARFLIQIATILGAAVHWGRSRAYSVLIEAREREHEAVEDLQSLNAELERFAAVVAHDLKNPITAIRLKLRAMRSRSGDEQVHAAALELDHMANNMNTLIEDLLAYAQAGADLQLGEPDALDAVATQVVELLQDAAAEAGGVIRIDPLPHYEADATLLRQLLQNLVGNAITHRADRAPTIVIGGEDTPRGIAFWVQDNGPGFDASIAEELFEPFRRGETTRPGHGLGLATCARIVARLGGTIKVESTPGVGSRFTVLIEKMEEEGEKEIVAT